MHGYIMLCIIICFITSSIKYLSILIHAHLIGFKPNAMKELKKGADDVMCYKSIYSMGYDLHCCRWYTCFYLYEACCFCLQYMLLHMKPMTFHKKFREFSRNLTHNYQILRLILDGHKNIYLCQSTPLYTIPVNDVTF